MKDIVTASSLPWKLYQNNYSPQTRWIFTPTSWTLVKIDECLLGLSEKLFNIPWYPNPHAHSRRSTKLQLLKMCQGEFRLSNFAFWYPVHRNFTDSKVIYVINVMFNLSWGKQMWLDQMLAWKHSGVVANYNFRWKTASLKVSLSIFVLILLIGQ